MLFLLSACELYVPSDLPNLEATLTRIEEVRPRGELYLLSAIMEDFDTEVLEAGFISHYAVQVVKARCSYVLDLEKVNYNVILRDNAPVIKVTLPAPKVYCSTQNSPFYSDDEAFWAKQRSDKAGDTIKQFVENKIKRSFDSPENRRAANAYGKKIIGKTLELLGIIAEFVE